MHRRRSSLFPLLAALTLTTVIFVLFSHPWQTLHSRKPHRTVGHATFRDPEPVPSELRMGMSTINPQNSPASESPGSTSTLAASSSPPSPLIAITPTWEHVQRIPHLLRTAQSLQLAARKGPVLWVVVEDQPETAPHVQQRLEAWGLPYSYLASSLTVDATEDAKSKEFALRNVALDWLSKQPQLEGTVVFLDDDNIFTTEFFREARTASPMCIPVWPVGPVDDVAAAAFSTLRPLLERVTSEQVAGFLVERDGKLETSAFPTDLASSALHTSLLRQGGEFVKFPAGEDIVGRFLQQVVGDRLSLFRASAAVGEDGRKVLAFRARWAMLPGTATPPYVKNWILPQPSR